MQPRKHRDQAARQKAYRQRQKARKQAERDGVSIEEPTERVQSAGDAAIAEFFGRKRP